MTDTVIDGVTIAPSVVETIAGIAVNTVRGVRVSNSVVRELPSFIQSLIRRGASNNVKTWSEDEKTVNLRIHVSVSFDVNSEDAANDVRDAVSYALMCQMGISTGRIDVVIDSIGEL